MELEAERGSWERRGRIGGAELFRIPAYLFLIANIKHDEKVEKFEQKLIVARPATVWNVL